VTALSLLSTTLTYWEVRDQYNAGGVSNVNPVDFTGLVLGTTGLAASGLKYLNGAPEAMTSVSEFAGTDAIPIAVYQNWNMAFQITYNTIYHLLMVIVELQTSNFRLHLMIQGINGKNCLERNAGHLS
jgi:hypothetical protein